MDIEYEPYWNGAMEARGEFRDAEGNPTGLSRYQGRSSTFHSPNWKKSDALEHSESARAAHKPTARRPGTPRRELHEQILALLRKGASYGSIARSLDCSASVPRDLARKHGLDRRKFSSNWRHREAV